MNRSRHALRVVIGLMILLLAPLQSHANLWQDVFGQKWFYEIRSAPGEILAGTWYESSLTPGTTYHISFEVQDLEGRMALNIGDGQTIEVSTPGKHAYDFAVSEGGKRYLNFLTWSEDVVASVNKISVTEKTTNAATPTSSGTADRSRGHYLSFSRERNLKTEMADVLARPHSQTSSWERRIANELDGALTTPGVQGFQVTIDWRTLETGDGRYDWDLLDDNMKVARDYGLKLVVKMLDRSFDGTNVMPAYFPSDKVLWTTGGGSSGFVSKRWDPWVYKRTIRLYEAIANRYRSDEGFGGIATTESALGNFSDSSYTVEKYNTALTQIMTQTQAAMTRGKLFWYLNFIRGDWGIDLNDDSRVEMARQVPHDSLVLGGPDITPDVPGMVGSVNSYRIHLRKTEDTLSQFCHLQHVDQGLGDRNRKDNQHRREYQERVAKVRERESQSWFTGTPATFEFSTLDPTGDELVKLHPTWKLGDRWQLRELFDFGQANFGCDYVFWNYRRDWGNGDNQFYWDDVAPLIIDTRYFAR